MKYKPHLINDHKQNKISFIYLDQQEINKKPIIMDNLISCIPKRTILIRKSRYEK